MKMRKIASVILTAAIFFSSAAVITAAVPPRVVLAEASGKVDNVNPWGSGGQITINLSGCSGYQTITVVVEFSGTVKSASGWGFDSYTVDGNRVTAVVSADGANSWGFDSNVGIQVEGSDITSASLISVEGSGTAPAPNGGGNNNNNNGGNNGNNGNGGNNGNAGNGGSGSAEIPECDAVAGDDWLTTDGDKIVDQNGTEVWLTGVSWFGYNTGSNLFDGVWGCNLRSSLESIADHGFNLLRVPMSAELILQWKNGEYPEANYNHAYNSELESMNSLEIWEYVLDICEYKGIKVMIDIHSCKTDSMGHMMPMWYTSDFTEDQYIEALEWLAKRYANNDTIVAYDIKNEPHGKASETDHAIWNDSDDQNNWKRAAERAGNVILDANPHALIVIEGIQIYPIDILKNNYTSTDDGDYYDAWWGGNLRAVADYPIDFGSEARNKQVVYSPHDYGPSVYAQPWFEGGFTYQSLMDDYWYDSWLYIDDTKTAPLLIGEWGGFMTDPNLTWMTYMRQLIAEYHLNHTFWCFNANSGDTGGLVKDDFTTWDEEKYNFVKEVLWQDDSGKFVGLDHKVPLGENGISLKDYSGKDAVPELNGDPEPDGKATPTPTPAPSASPEQKPSAEPTGSPAPEETSSAPSGASDGATPAAGKDSSGSPVTYMLIGAGCVVGLAVLVAGGVFMYRLGRGKKE